jgi:hypothetical protein
MTCNNCNIVLISTQSTVAFELWALTNNKRKSGFMKSLISLTVNKTMKTQIRVHSRAITDGGLVLFEFHLQSTVRHCLYEPRPTILF